MAPEKRNLYFIFNGAVAICGLVITIFGFLNKSIQNKLEEKYKEDPLESYQSIVFHIQCIYTGILLMLMAGLGINATLTEKIKIHKIQSVIIGLITIFSFGCTMSYYMVASEFGDEIDRKSQTLEIEGINSRTKDLMERYEINKVNISLTKWNYAWIGLFEIIGIISSHGLIFLSFTQQNGDSKMTTKKRKKYFASNGLLVIFGLVITIWGIWNKSNQNESTGNQGKQFLEVSQSEYNHIQCILSGIILMLMACLGVFATQKIMISKITILLNNYRSNSRNIIPSLKWSHIWIGVCSFIGKLCSRLGVIHQVIRILELKTISSSSSFIPS